MNLNLISLQKLKMIRTLGEAVILNLIYALISVQVKKKTQPYIASTLYSCLATVSRSMKIMCLRK